MTLSFLVCGAVPTTRIFRFQLRFASIASMFRLVAGGVPMHGAFDGLDYAAETMFNQTK